jgi:AcrR family transcriptional regulator
MRFGRPPKELAGEVDARILDAARKIFLERGFEGASIDEIAEVARSGKPTIYARFRDKRALFTAVVTRDILSRITEFKSEVPTGATIEERLTSAAITLLHWGFDSELELAEPHSQYLGASDFHYAGPARVVAGEYDGVKSVVESPRGITYLDVRLKAGERWTFHPTKGHDVAWIASHQGTVTTPEQVTIGEAAVFEEGDQAIEFEALSDAGFILGSAVKHPYDLVTGHYSVHTNADEAFHVQQAAQIRAYRAAWKEASSIVRVQLA